MQKLLGSVAIAALICASPQLALAQSSSQTQQSSQAKPSLRQQVKDNLAQAGFTNIRVMPQSFLVRATDKSGNPVMMVINPDSVTEIAGMSSNQANGNSSEGQTVSKSAKMTDRPANLGAQEQSEANQTPSQSAKMNGESTQNMQAQDLPGRQNGMTAELKQDEHQALNLTPAQRSQIWNQLGSEGSEQTPSGFTAQIGETTPNGMQLTPIPGQVSGQIPAVKSYQYAKLQSKLLLVDPSSKKIVAIITE